MSDVTVKQLAEVLAVPIERLMEQLESAGIDVSSEEDTISNESKMKLLEFLRGSHGKERASLSPRKKVVLKRKSQSVLRVAGSGGIKSKTKNINIEVKKKKRPTGPSQAEMEEIERERKAAQEALDARKDQLANEEKEREEAVRQETEAVEEAKRKEAEATAEQQREEKERQEAEDAEKRKLEAAEQEVREAKEREEAEAEAERKAREAEDEKKRRRDELVDQQVQKAVRERADRKRREQQGQNQGGGAPKPAANTNTPPNAGAAKPGGRNSGGRNAGNNANNRQKTRYGRKQLHMQPNRGGSDKKRPMVASAGSDKHGFQRPTVPKILTVEVPESISVGDLGKAMSVKSGDVIKVLMNMGMMVTINQMLDQDTAILVVEEMGHTAKEAVEHSREEKLKADMEKTVTSSDEEHRPPVVTVMGHVDHGKTSLLDYIRESKVTDKEAGGITQHIGAYHVQTDHGVISFIDTPGHAAFTAMRARGAQVTDIVILVVAANDGVMPQTVEAIDHARAANVPIIVAVNKMDLQEANPDRVKQDLTAHEVVAEDWGGDVQFVPISALTGQGIDDLLESISLQAEVLELTAVKDAPASGIVVESSLDIGRGPVATVLVKSGTLKKGDMILCGEQFGRIRSLINEQGDEIASAGPSIPAVVLGLSGVPIAGDDFLVVADKKQAREAAEENRNKERQIRLQRQQAAKLENLMSQMGQEEKLQVNLLVKADVQGSVEALRDSLVKLSNDDVVVNVISSGVGGITNADAQLAAASNAIIIGFNVRADKAAREIIRESDLDLHYFSIIYEAIDQVKASVTGVLGTETKEKIIGLAEVRDVFRSSAFGTVAGCLVAEGVVKRDNPIRVLRDNVVVFEGELESLRRHKDDVKEVQAGTECGIGVKQYKDVQAGDQIECYERYEVQRTLD
ncbi:translation initiation factor IF-2 [Marinicella sp. W31]|uniref:translation initiation factor IF-2 n=1 Tax=Marinicella sp. W31 TaxID=3023713 RepID=UPI003756B10D